MRSTPATTDPGRLALATACAVCSILSLLGPGRARAEWIREVVDTVACPDHADAIGNSSVARHGIAVDASGQPHLAYHRNVYICPPDRIALVYATRAAGTWTTEVLRSFAIPPGFSFVDVAVTPAGIPFVHATQLYSKAGGTWSSEPTTFSGTLSTSLALDADGVPHVTGHDLGAFCSHCTYYASKETGVWSVPFKVQGCPFPGAPACQQASIGSSLAVGADGEPRIAMANWGGGFDLLLATRAGGSWSIDPIEPLRHSGQWMSLALDAQNRAHIAYRDSIDEIRIAHQIEGGGWSSEIVPLPRETTDTTYTSYYFVSLALDGDDVPHLACAKETWQGSVLLDRDVIHATRPAGEWQIDVVDTAGNVGFDASIAVDADGLPHIAYVDVTAGTQKYARPVTPAGVAGRPRDSGLELLPVRPNPTTHGARIVFRLARGGPVRLAVFDVHGRLVRRLLDGPMTPGEHAVAFDGTTLDGATLPAGVYLLRLESGGVRVTRRVVRVP